MCECFSGCCSNLIDLCFSAARLGLIEQLKAAEAESAAHEQDVGEISFSHSTFSSC
jgi:hypothetical protein